MVEPFAKTEFSHKAKAYDFFATGIYQLSESLFISEDTI